MAVFTVTNLNESGAGSLRQAIADSNSVSGADKIDFHSSLLGAGPLVLSATSNQLRITDDVTIDGDIDGDNVADIAISGAGSTRVFWVNSVDVTFDALKIVDGSSAGSANSESGGGLYIAAGGTTTIKNSEFSGNAARSGAAVFNLGTLNTFNSTFSDGNAVSGGGIYNLGEANIVNSLVSGNIAFYGGGMSNFAGASVNIHNSTFAENRALSGGGLLNGSGAVAYIANDTFTGNWSEVAKGGGIENNGFVVLINSIVAGNSSLAGNPDIFSPGSTFYGGPNVFSQAGAGGPGGIVESNLGNIFATTALIDPDGIPANGNEFLGGLLANAGGAIESVAIISGGVAHNTGIDLFLPVDILDVDGDGDTAEKIPFDTRGDGFVRGFSGQSDLGAFELGPPEVAYDDAFGQLAENVVLHTGVNVFADNGSGIDFDPDGNPFSVILVNGNAAAVNSQITLDSGALLLLNADGTFSYDPNGAYEFVPDPASGAVTTAATDTFTYTVTGGDSAIVTVTISGIDNNDVLTGATGVDVLHGGVGNDVLDGGAGNDTLDGGAGLDTASYESAATGITQYLFISGLDTGGAGIDILSDIENLTGSDFNDRLVGDGNDNVLIGGSGNDILKGRGGHDTFNGGVGDDKLTGGAGNDTMFGGDGNDVLSARGGLDALSGGKGDDFLYGGHDSDILNGNFGFDKLRGNRGNDILNGGANNDDLRGGGQNDTLNGDTGDDYLFGGNHVDTLFGGAGNDSMSGGLGGGTGDGFTDTFIYKETAGGGGGFDRIKDFEDGIDVMNLQSFGFADFAAVQVLASNSGSGLRIDFGSGDVLFVENFQLADFDVGDVLI